MEDPGNKAAQPCAAPPAQTPAWQVPLLQGAPFALGGAAPHTPVAWSQAPAALSHSPGAAQVTPTHKSAFGGDGCLSGTSQRGCCLSKHPARTLQAEAWLSPAPTCAHASLAGADAAGRAVCLGRRRAAHPSGVVAGASGALAFPRGSTGDANAQVCVWWGWMFEWHESAWLLLE